MNPINVERLPKKILRDPEALGNICVNLAFQMSGGQWHAERVRTVEFSREVIDQIKGEEPSLRRIAEAFSKAVTPEAVQEENEKKPLRAEPTFTTTRVVFNGFKQARKDEKNVQFDSIRYHLSTSVRQSIQESEIPEHILDKIFDNHGEPEDDDEHARAWEEESVLEYAERGTMDEQIEMERELYVEYGIDQDGEIDTYRIDHTYYFNDQNVHEVSYDTEQARMLRDEDAEPEDTQEFTEKWQAFMEREDVKEAMEIGTMTLEEHRVRALGMFSLLLQDVFPVKEFAQRNLAPKQL